VPMCLLYEAGIFAARWFIKTTKSEEDEAAETGAKKDRDDAPKP